MPADAVVMATVQGLFRVQDGQSLRMPTGDAVAVPQAAQLVIGLNPDPRLALTLTLEDAQQADRWVKAVDGLRSQGLSHPLVLLSGLTGPVKSLSARIPDDDERQVRIETSGTPAEAVRVLTMITNLLGPRTRPR